MFNPLIKYLTQVVKALEKPLIRQGLAEPDGSLVDHWHRRLRGLKNVRVVPVWRES